MSRILGIGEKFPNFSGQAVVSLRGPDGRRRDVYLGAYNSPQGLRAIRACACWGLVGSIDLHPEAVRCHSPLLRCSPT